MAPLRGFQVSEKTEAEKENDKMDDRPGPPGAFTRP
jgi:hypothetical protein